MDAARLPCQDAAKEVFESSSCKLGGVSLYAGGTTFLVRKLFSLLCGFYVGVAFKGVNTLGLRELKLNMNRDWRKEAGRIPYKISMPFILGKINKARFHCQWLNSSDLWAVPQKPQTSTESWGKLEIDTGHLQKSLLLKLPFKPFFQVENPDLANA